MRLAKILIAKFVNALIACVHAD